MSITQKKTMSKVAAMISNCSFPRMTRNPTGSSESMVVGEVEGLELGETVLMMELGGILGEDDGAVDGLFVGDNGDTLGNAVGLLLEVGEPVGEYEGTVEG